MAGARRQVSRAAGGSPRKGIIGWLYALLIAIAAIGIALLLGAYVNRSGPLPAVDAHRALPEEHYAEWFGGGFELA